jgi:hypothetical protein
MARLEGLFGLPALRPSGHQQKALMLKIAPGNFFEPNDEQKPSGKINKKAPSKIEGAFLLYGAPGRIIRASCPHPFGAIHKSRGC